MGESLKGKVAIVTGSGQGVGRAIALALAEEGARVVTNNRVRGGGETGQITPEIMASLPEKEKSLLIKRYGELRGDAETTAKAIKDAGGEAIAYFGDVSDYEVARGLVNIAVETYGAVDILVNAAGSDYFGPVTGIGEDALHKIYNTKPKGYYNMIHFAAAHMIKKGWGRILNCTGADFTGDELLHPQDCAANASVIGFTRALYLELGEHGITCNAFAPVAKTRAVAELEALTSLGNDKNKISVKPVALTPYDLYPDPEYVAPFILWLSGDAAARINGCVFRLEGNAISVYNDEFLIKSVIKDMSEMWTLDELVDKMPKTVLAGYESITGAASR